MVHRLLPARLGDAAGFELPAPACIPGGDLGMGRGERLAPDSSVGFEV